MLLLFFQRWLLVTAMGGMSFLRLLTIFSILGYVSSKQVTKKISCQQKSTSGYDYAGEANTTIEGIPCQKWLDTQPHYHRFTHVGDHNFCRNPIGSGVYHSRVWCYTTDPKVPYQDCSVPFCPPLKALDFSLDNDDEPDESNSYTHAEAQKV